MPVPKTGSGGGRRPGGWLRKQLASGLYIWNVLWRATKIHKPEKPRQIEGFRKAARPLDSEESERRISHGALGLLREHST